MGGQTKGTTREERVARAIERNKKEAEEREKEKQIRIQKQREERKLQSDKEDAISQYLIENNLQMELDKLYILDVAGEEVTIQPGKDDSFQWYRVNFSKGREVIDYEIIKDEEGQIFVKEVKDSRLSVRKQKRTEETLMMLSAMSSLGRT